MIRSINTIQTRNLTFTHSLCVIHGKIRFLDHFLQMVLLRCISDRRGNENALTSLVRRIKAVMID